MNWWLITLYAVIAFIAMYMVFVILRGGRYKGRHAAPGPPNYREPKERNEPLELPPDGDPQGR